MIHRTSHGWIQNRWQSHVITRAISERSMWMRRWPHRQIVAKQLSEKMQLKWIIMSKMISSTPVIDSRVIRVSFFLSFFFCGETVNFFVGDQGFFIEIFLFSSSSLILSPCSSDHIAMDMNQHLVLCLGIFFLSVSVSLSCVCYCQRSNAIRPLMLELSGWSSIGRRLTK